MVILGFGAARADQKFDAVAWIERRDGRLSGTVPAAGRRRRIGIRVNQESGHAVASAAAGAGSRVKRLRPALSR